MYGSKVGTGGKMKAEQMLVLTNMLGKIIAELDDVRAMIKESTYEDFVGEEG
tara:strand:+ start:1513 stop:1668 length:156 start_codon:yes stop_codon:yes gene_type:complete